MPNGEVHWHEGMFLRQHHFLTEHRQLVRLMQVNDQWSQHYGWGLRSIQLNPDSLGNFRFAVTSMRARLRDGTAIEVPEDGLLPELDLKPALEANRRVTVHLAVPALRSGHPNVSDSGPTDSARYYLISRDLEDENRGVSPQPLEVRRLNLKLLLSTDNAAGYDVIPIARVEKSERADATPQLDVSYIPPVLACDAWTILQVEILQEVYDRVGRKIEKLAGQAVSRGMKPETATSDAVLVFAQLRELNEAYAVLTNLAFVEGIHPLPAYQELCRIVGQLAVFSESRRTPAIPRYNHDDLGGCFHRVKNYLDDLLMIVPEPDYQERPFIGHGLRLQVELERPWLEAGADLYIGVTSPLDATQCAEVLGRGKKIDMKVGSPDRIESLYRLGEAGLQFAMVPEREIPSALPRDPGRTYFQINRGQQQSEWQSVERALALAVRFNENLVVGGIDGLETVTIRLPPEMPFRFRLYVLGVKPPGPGR
jgi:type VI secretion system protein ImpJ